MDELSERLVQAAEKAISHARFIDDWVSLGELATVAVLRELAGPCIRNNVISKARIEELADEIEKTD